MTDFLGLDLHTTKETFIPRPETELLVEVCLGVMQELQADSPLHILDIGTGTGNIAIPLTKIRRDCKIVALDKSEEALAVAGKNAEKFGVLDKIEFVTSDIFSSLARARKFDIIVSNPPYVSTWEIATLSDCVKDEPRMALDGGEDGLDFYRRIIADAPGFLKGPGCLIMEIGYNQSFYVKRLLEEARFKDIEIFKDSSGIDRVIKAKNG
ncbi:MAG: peptide chain release factor N(5)-glutamine methyltransferase [Candidatus Omnitrophica bacterium]|nr:peptide chain release factor N(5)-glutamine methyltransferase [Candidatus Omnitrophota bacterium]